MIYIVISIIVLLAMIYAVYDVRRLKRIRKQSTKLDSELYRRKDGNR